MFGEQNQGARKASDIKDNFGDPPDSRSRLSMGSVPTPPMNMLVSGSGDRKQQREEFQGFTRNATDGLSH
jgi:hypothetical protein